MNNNQSSTTATAPTTAEIEILNLRHLLRATADGRDATLRTMIESRIAALESQLLASEGITIVP